MYKLDLNLNNYQKKIDKNQIMEFYIKNKDLYEYCDFISSDERRFGFIIDKKSNSLYIIREVNKNYFLLTRLEKNVSFINEEPYFILPYKVKDKIILWYPEDNKLKRIGDYFNNDLLFINNIFKFKYNKGIVFLVDDYNYYYKYEDILLDNFKLSQLNFISRKLYEVDKNESDYKKKDYKEIRYAILNSYETYHKSFINPIKKNLTDRKMNIENVDIYNTNNLDKNLDFYFNQYDCIIYFGHGYSDENHLNIKLNKTIPLKYDKSLENKYRKSFYFLACNESVDKQYKSDYNSIKSLLNVGFTDIIITEAIVEKDDIICSFPYLIILDNLLKSTGIALTLLKRLEYSVISVKMPFLLYRI